MPKKQTVKGIILPNDWDTQGKLIEVVLYDTDEAEFVLHGKHDAKLLDLCHNRVSCTGKKVLDNRGRWLFEVDDFSVLGNETDCGYLLESEDKLYVNMAFPRMWNN